MGARVTRVTHAGAGEVAAAGAEGRDGVIEGIAPRPTEEAEVSGERYIDGLPSVNLRARQRQGRRRIDRADEYDAIARHRTVLGIVERKRATDGGRSDKGGRVLHRAG